MQSKKNCLWNFIINSSKKKTVLLMFHRHFSLVEIKFFRCFSCEINIESCISITNYSIMSMNFNSNERNFIDFEETHFFFCNFEICLLCQQILVNWADPLKKLLFFSWLGTINKYPCNKCRAQYITILCVLLCISTYSR